MSNVLNRINNARSTVNNTLRDTGDVIRRASGRLADAFRVNPGQVAHRPVTGKFAPQLLPAEQIARLSREISIDQLDEIIDWLKDARTHRAIELHHQLIRQRLSSLGFHTVERLNFTPVEGKNLKLKIYSPVGVLLTPTIFDGCFWFGYVEMTQGVFLEVLANSDQVMVFKGEHDGVVMLAWSWLELPAPDIWSQRYFHDLLRKNRVGIRSEPPVAAQRDSLVDRMKQGMTPQQPKETLDKSKVFQNTPVRE